MRSRSVFLHLLSAASVVRLPCRIWAVLLPWLTLLVLLTSAALFLTAPAVRPVILLASLVSAVGPQAMAPVARQAMATATPVLHGRATTAATRDTGTGAV